MVCGLRRGVIVASSCVCMMIISMTPGAEAFPPPCTLDKDSKNTITRFDKTPVCVSLNQQNYALFDPEADEYSMFQLNGSSRAVPTGTGVIKEGEPKPKTDFTLADCKDKGVTGQYFVTVDAFSFDAKSDYSRIYQLWDCEKEGGKNTFVTYFNVLTAIVHADNGEAKFISYDDGCFFCDSSDRKKCKEIGFNTSAALAPNDGTDRRSCGIKCSISDLENGRCSACDDGKCDLKVYVVWTGEDSDGQFFESAGLRFSRFRQFGLGGLMKNARTKGTQGFSGAEQTAGDAENLFS
eukprot:gb/GECG01013213.1/.p1 GENE.gb/GECG01013213.1/~~gb/GECG01013213.1/.p1  ORF type:complete len:294 (+),score=33.47 gb/GECG01013213.1/:1-882(+)